MQPRKANEEREARRFGLILAALLALLGAWSLWRGRPFRGGNFLAGALVSATCALFFLPQWTAFFRRYMQVVGVLASVTTAVLLGGFFYLVLTPFGLVRRLVGRSPLDRTWKDGSVPAWIDREPEETTIERYEKPF